MSTELSRMLGETSLSTLMIGFSLILLIFTCIFLLLVMIGDAVIDTIIDVIDSPHILNITLIILLFSPMLLKVAGII